MDQACDKPQNMGADAPAVALLSDRTAEALLLAYTRGDASAFNHLFARFERPVYRYVLRHVRDAHQADEVFQDVWLALIKHAASYQPEGRFESWLFTIAHHRVMDFFREKSADRETENIDAACDDGAHFAPQFAASRSDQPEVRLMARHQARAFLDLVEALPEVQREAFLLQEEAAMSLPEIAAVTGVGVETVKSRLRYAMGKLRSGMALAGWRCGDE